jgi:uncharacterized protein YcfJ
MRLHGLSVRLFAGLALVGVVLSGCQNMNHAQRGTAVGATAGTVLGAIIGHQSGHKELGALIGAGTGAVAGHIIGNSQDVAEQRDEAIVQAHHAQRQQEFVQRAVTNHDIIEMTRQGLSEQIIIGAITERGGRFDTSPDGLVGLQNSGVSQTVMQTMQQYNTRRY